MRRSLLRRPAAAAAFGLFALFWGATVAEAWCPMHAHREAPRETATHHAASHERAPDAPRPGCRCPGDCSGTVAASVPHTPMVLGAALAVFASPPAATRVASTPARDQLRLPFANAPPVA